MTGGWSHVRDIAGPGFICDESDNCNDKMQLEVSGLVPNARYFWQVYGFQSNDATATFEVPGMEVCGCTADQNCGTCATSQVGEFTVQTFTSTCANTKLINPNPALYIDALLVGGGGGGGWGIGGGGAGGGVVYLENVLLPEGSHELVVGAGGAGSTGDFNGGKGGSSTLLGQTALGGGGGGSDNNDMDDQGDMANGGGASADNCNNSSCNRPGETDVAQPQPSINGVAYGGHSGGNGNTKGPDHLSGGGAGAGGDGNSVCDACGGPGVEIDITGTAYYWGGGGGGGNYGTNTRPNGGKGGGGGGSCNNNNPFGIGGGSALNKGEDGVSTSGTNGSNSGGRAGANTARPISATPDFNESAVLHSCGLWILIVAKCSAIHP